MPTAVFSLLRVLPFRERWFTSQTLDEALPTPDRAARAYQCVRALSALLLFARRRAPFATSVRTTPWIKPH